MSVVVDEAGVTIQTVDEILEEIIVALGTELGLSAVQVQRIRASVKSTIGQLARVEAEREAALQEGLLAVYSTISFFSNGAALDRVVRLLGVVRSAALSSRVTGPATGTPGTIIPNNSRIQYDPEGTVWIVVDGPYTISGGGTVTIAVESEDTEAVTVALDPDSGFDEWTILDTVVGWTAFESAAQPVTGAPSESDASLRTRATTEAFRRGQGPLRAIEAAVTEVTGVTYVRAYENRTWTTDANGLPGKSINVVAVGGDDDEVGAAIFTSRSAGAEVFALVDGTEVATTQVDNFGFSHSMPFNRVADVDLWIRATLTTSTAEDAAPADVDNTVEELLLEQAVEMFGIGDDVRPYMLTGAIFASGLPGIDAVVVELSDDGATWQTTKWPISIREQAAFDAARISVVLV